MKGTREEGVERKGGKELEGEGREGRFKEGKDFKRSQGFLTALLVKS